MNKDYSFHVFMQMYLEISQSKTTFLVVSEILRLKRINQ